MKQLPTEFRGVIFDDGWEFDMPCVIYYPVEIYGIGGGARQLESMVEDYCIDLSLNHKPSGKLSKFEQKEFKWRGWTMIGMSRRKKNATHYIFTVRWYFDMYDRFEIMKTRKK